MKKHGFAHKERLYEVWKNMRRRCMNPKNNRAKNYILKGVTFCEEWNNYLNFRTWALENGYDENAPYGQCTLDRIDNDGNYEPSNCRWTTAKVQENNMSRNRIIEYNGVTKTMSQWADFLGISYSAMIHRVQRNWSMERIVSTPQRRRVNGHYIT